jgi:transcriptional regulator with XRE-family HTH domain
MHWGEFVREKRLEAGYGLRQFAALVGILPSNYNHMEKGRMSPPQDKARLDQIAEVLGIEPGTEDSHTLMDLAVEGKNKLPADVAEFARQNELVPVLLRTLENRKPSREEFENLVRQLNDDLCKPRRPGESGDGPESPGP